MITCDEIIDPKGKSCDEETKSIPTNFNEKKENLQTQNVYVLLTVLTITIILLVTVNIYSYLIKYRAKQKHLLPFHATNN